MEQEPKRKLRKLPVVLSLEEINKLFSIIDKPRDSIMIRATYYLGLRVNELISLKVGDINLKEEQVRLRAETTKRSKERRIPIPKIFKKSLQQYLNLIGNNPETKLFPLTKQRVWQIIKHYSKKAGITKQIHPHTLRHSYATHIYEKTHDIKLVQDLLGHENITTTQIYTHLTQEDKKKGVNEVFK